MLPPAIKEGYALALRKLAVADCSRQEMLGWLKRHDCVGQVAQAVVAELEARNYLNDQRLCASLCERWLEYGACGRLLLKSKLMKRGLAASMIEEELSSLEIDEYAKAEKVFLAFAKKLKSIDERSLPKILRHMAAKGFDYHTTRQALDRHKRELAALLDEGLP